MVIGLFCTKLVFLYGWDISKMATTAMLVWRRDLCEKLFLRNYRPDWSPFILEWSLDDPLQSWHFCVDRYTKMATTAILTLNITLWENEWKKFLKTTNMIEPKLCSDGHWVVPYNIGILIWMWCNIQDSRHYNTW